MKKISYKLALYVFSAILIIEIILFSFLYTTIIGNQIERTMLNLVEQGNVYSHSIVNDKSLENMERIAFLEKNSNRAVVITDYTRVKPIVKSENVTNEMLKLLKPNPYVVPKTGKVEGSQWRTDKYIYTASPIIFHKATMGYVFMFEDTKHIQSLVQEISRQFFYAFLFTIIAMIFSILLISFHVTRPIVEIQKITRELIKGNYDVTQMKIHKRKDEIGELMESIYSLQNELHDLKVNRNEFLASIAHELRTPLTYIKGYVDVLQYQQVDEKKYKKYMNILKEETKHLKELIDNLFFLARIEQNEFIIQKTEVNIHDFISSMTLRTEHAFEEQGQQIQVQAEHIQRQYIHMDEQRMEQVWMNIIRNAVQYSNTNQPIIINIKEVGNQLCFQFKDSGMGMAKEELQHVFKRFYRIEKSRTRATGGAGLGLAIVKEIVEKHSGKIDIQSEVGKGTTVTVCVPFIS